MIITFQHFLLAVSHNVDVLYADELEFDVGVVVFILVAFSGSSVCDCIQLQRHALNHQNILLEERKKTTTKKTSCYAILMIVQQAHSQDVFEGLCCEHIQLPKPTMENKAHLNIQHSTVRVVCPQGSP